MNRIQKSEYGVSRSQKVVILEHCQDHPDNARVSEVGVSGPKLLGVSRCELELASGTLCDIVISDRFSQLIQFPLAAPGSSPGASILHLLGEDTTILYNSTSVGCVKLQALLFCAKLLFSMGQAIDVLVESVQRKESMSIDSNWGHGLQGAHFKVSQ